MAPQPPAHPALSSSRYELLDEAGRGAMGVVYRARDRESGATVALKALHGGDPDDLYRLKNEFRALAGVVHPHLVRLYEMSVEGDRGFFTMELVEGARTIVEVARDAGPTANVVRETFRQLASALAALHEAGWLHRDLKPSNVLVDARGRLVLLDFGLVRGLGREQLERTQIGTVVGTLGYMSPEQALGRSLSAASDWYSFGVLLYECLAGRSPFAGASAASLLDRSRLLFPPASAFAPECPADLSDLAGALLANDPLQRPGERRVLALLAGEGGAGAEAPARLGSVFVGRDGELLRLRQAWGALRGGVTAVAAIEGSSGLGKTSLVERFVADLPAKGALVLRARCYPHEVVPFEALDEVVDDLSRYLSSLAQDRLDALLPRDTAALLRVFPVLGRASLPAISALPEDGAAEPHELRRRGFAALRELLARLADRRALVIWIDDLQWADADSGPLLRELLRPPDPPRILWLLSFRAEDRRQNPLLRDLDRLLEAVPRENRHEITLGPLTRSETDQLLGELAESPLSDADADAIARESQGSPFLLSELIRRDVSGATRPRHDVDLDGVIQRRLAGLPAAARRLLESVVVTSGPLERSVALEAAGLGVSDPGSAALLESTRLLRVVAGEGRTRLEVYHDQIREVIDRQLTGGDRRARHAEVASALERRGSDDAALLFAHHAGAGHRASAATWAIAAAERSEQQLAFDQAARFYRAALEQDRSAIDARRALAQLAEALANAGRGPQSAAAFEEAAAEADAADAEALYQRAAEQYLVCGRLEDGRRVLLPLLASHGVRYPTTTAGSLLLTLAYLPKLALRFLRGDTTPGEPSQELLLRIDACNRAARGTVVVDPVRATYFSVRSLVDALRCHDGFRIGRTLCFVGTTLAPLAGPVSRLAKPVLERAERIASEVRDARLDGMIRVSKAQVAFVAGDFSSMLDLCDAGARLLADDGRGVRWDWDVAQMGAMRALEELGRADEIQRRLPGLIDQALSLEDLYAEVTFRLYDGFWRIARGDIETARETARWVVERWGGVGFQLQHLYALRIEACCDVYERAQRTGWSRLEEAWPAIRRSGLLAHLMLRSDALALRARLALAAGGDVEREVERAARAFDKMRRPDANATACMLRAALSSRRGDVASAVALLARAEASYAGASMALHVAYARRRRGELVGGDAGDALVWEANRALDAAGIKSPERWIELHAPGFGAAPV